MKRVRILKDTGLLVGNDFSEYATMPTEVFIEKFLPRDNSYCIVSENEPADICCYGVGLKDEISLRDNELNVFISVENLEHWGDPTKNIYGRQNEGYHFYKKYKHFDSKKTNIYIHNDKSSITTPQYKCIPTIFFRLSYFERMEKKYRMSVPDFPFEQKRDILFISKNHLNPNKNKFAQFCMDNKFTTDNISQYNNILKNTSCYHSSEILNVLSRYKFIAAFENSNTNEYITEKIFNVFFAKSIPIYDGAPNITEFINPHSFLKLDSNIWKKMIIIKNSKKIYEKIVNTNKIQSKYKKIDIKY